MTGERRDIHNSDIPVLCWSCEARHRGICSVLQPDELVALARLTHKADYPVGAQLSGESAEIHSYANVMKGVVKLTKGLEDGRQQVVGLQFAPDFLGQLFGEENKVAAEAVQEVELCVIPRPALDRILSENPALARRIMQQKLRELDEARDWIVTLGRKRALEKVASFLHLIASSTEPGTATSCFDLPLTRADIADFLGLTLETVSRQLTKLRKLGLIEIRKRRRVEILDLPALTRLCG